MEIQQRLADLEAALAQQQQTAEQWQVATEHKLNRMKCRLGTTWACAFVGIVGAFVLGLSPEARAQFGVTLATLNTRLTAVENKTRFVSVSGAEMFITGANLNIRSGSGSTEGEVNGRGNLIIGYNEAQDTFGDERGGSHNLVIGNFHDYSSYGGLVAGQYNRVINEFTSVTGGNQNTGVLSMPVLVEDRKTLPADFSPRSRVVKITRRLVITPQLLVVKVIQPAATLPRSAVGRRTRQVPLMLPSVEGRKTRRAISSLRSAVDRKILPQATPPPLAAGLAIRQGFSTL